MKWLSEMWAKSSAAVQIALIVAVVAVVGLVLWFLGGPGLAGLGTWLGGN